MHGSVCWTSVLRGSPPPPLALCCSGNWCRRDWETSLVGCTMSIWVQGKTAMWRRDIRERQRKRARETDRKPRNRTSKVWGRIVLWISAMETPYDDAEDERQEKRGTSDSFSWNPDSHESERHASLFWKSILRLFHCITWVSDIAGY